MHSPETISSPITTKTEHFFDEVVLGLKAIPKYLPSKYFYDERGDRIFRDIMNCPDYYLTQCELEILSGQSGKIAKLLHDYAGTADVVELGPGDASKSTYLLEELLKTEAISGYYPVDISSNVISMLTKDLPHKLPGLHIHGLNGEYFDMLEQINDLSDKRKIVLFLGANIGNFSTLTARHFCMQLRQYLKPGDMLLTGIDLKKHPQVIRNAYNDRQGLTASFNLNLLGRINRELEADFEITQFDHYPNYDPATGACKSYLVSRTDQKVHIKGEVLHFKENETIFMEISQKYSPEEIDRLAVQSGFKPLFKFFDSKKWFTDCLWQYDQPSSQVSE
jgi:dimethylhistidine N-methyltransferase